MHKIIQEQQYSRVPNPKILEVQAVSRVFNPEILEVQAASRVLPPEILEVQAVSRVLDPEILEVQAVSRVVLDRKILPVQSESDASKPKHSQNAQFKHHLASKPGVPAESKGNSRWRCSACLFSLPLLLS